jgi:hypothetical protein
MEETHHKHVHHAKHRRKWIFAGIVVIIIIAIAALALSGSSAGAVGITGSTTLHLNSNPKAIVLDGNHYLVYVASTSAQLKTATLYVKSLPIFSGSAYNVKLVLNSSTHVNLQSTYSDINFVLDSINGSSAVVTATPVDLSLGIAPDSGYIQQLPHSLFGVPETLFSSQPVANVPVSNSSTAASTTSVTSTAGTTTRPTTTVAAPQVNQTHASIISELKTSGYYGLMQNYSDAYALSNSSCDYEQYNTAFSQNNGGAIPSGPEAYNNVTAIVPYNITMSITSAGRGNYDITYYTNSHNPETTGKVLALELNMSSLNFISSQYSGAFEGQTTSELEAAYSVIASEGACGAYVG